jgi:MscS family membrane protein
LSFLFEYNTFVFENHQSEAIMFEKLNEIIDFKFLDNQPSNIASFILLLAIGLIFRRLLSDTISYLIYILLKRLPDKILLKDFIQTTHRPLSNSILLIFIYLAIVQLRFPSNWDLQPTETFGLKMVFHKSYQVLLVLSFVIILFRWINFFGKLALDRAKLTESKMDDHLVPFIKELTKVGTVIFTFFFILGAIFDVNVPTIIAGLGIGGLAVALAGKETLENLFASFTIFLDQPFVAGDLVKLGTIIGRIEKVGFRTTRIRTLERALLTIPNKMMVDQPLENWTNRSVWRVFFKLPLPYNTPRTTILAIKSQILEYLQAHPKTDQNNEIYFAELGEYSMNLSIYFFVITNNYSELEVVREETNFKICEIVENNGVSFAIPTQKIQFLNAE